MEAAPIHPDPRSLAQPRLSVVVAVFNEAENVQSVLDELTAALDRLQPFEVLFVDDGSTDATAERVAAMAKDHPGLRLLRHDRRCGKTAALRTGVAAAPAAWVAPLGGAGPHAPAALPGLLARGLSAPAAGPMGAAPLVAGIRLRRHDTLSRRIATRFANRLRQAVLADGCPDTGCGLKAFRRDDFLRLPAFEGMHRFLPALFQAYGHPLLCKTVTHRARLRGQSKYTNLGRALVGIGDMLGVIWLRSRTTLPRKVSES